MDFKNIKNIIFDLGDVIINIDPSKTYQAFADLMGKSLEDTKAQFDDLQVFERYESGDFSNASFITFLKENLNLDSGDDKIIKAWNEILLDIPAHRVETIKRLEGKYRLFLLSNTSDLHIIETNRRLKAVSGIEKLDDLFEIAFYSYKLEIRKPDPEIYLRVMKQGNMKPEETLFLDDNSDNVRSASALGIHTIQVKKDSSITEYLKDA